MPEVHPTATVDDSVLLADDDVVGPQCVLSGNIEIGAGTRLIGHVYVEGPLTMGHSNVVYPFSCFGFAPQHTAADRTEPGLGVFIGDRNTFREHFTVHRAFADDGATRIGDGNYCMANSHVGHDAIVGDDCTLTISSLLGGHVHMNDGAIMGGQSSVHQHCRIGRGAMVSGQSALNQDLLPFMVSTGISHVVGVNLVGLRRRGMPRADIDTIRWVYRTLYRERHSQPVALDLLCAREDDPIVAEYIRFIAGTKRGISQGQAKARRSKVRVHDGDPEA